MNKPLILCAEDNENDITLMQRIFDLKLKEFDVVFHTNTEDCITFLKDKFLKKELPILAVLDIKLINSNGLEILKFIKQDSRFKNIPVIMWSSSDRQDDKMKAKEFGCDDYIEKPKNYLDLKSKLPEVIFSWSKKNNAKR